MIKFQLLATKVGNTIKTVGTYWILDSINGRATGVSPVIVRGLRGATLTPLQHKTGTIPYWTVPNKTTPSLVHI